MCKSDLKIISASVEHILGEYNHSFSIDNDDGFVILYGPNGVGKTKFLEIINAITRLNGYALSYLPFETATLTYSDESILSVKRDIENGINQNEDSSLSFPIDITLERPNGSKICWSYKVDNFKKWIELNLPYEQISEYMWLDVEDGEVFHIDELRERFQKVNKEIIQSESDCPKELREFVNSVPSFFIEAQRLRAESKKVRASLIRIKNRLARNLRRPSSRIREQAEIIQKLVNEAQTEHSRITQRLDRTFPNRVLSEISKDLKLDSETIRASYNEQNDFRGRLGRVASVDLDNELSLPSDNLDNWSLTLLDLYLKDTKQKLRPFEVLLKKIELLEKIINSRLLNKYLQITGDKGLSVLHSGNDKPIDLDSLSSGEQHEIILMIDLLFNVPDGALVLIDEPEISLHVAWQIKFIPDVIEIAKLSKFCFVVATHSPQIVNDQWERAFRLGPSEEIPS